ncbi:hypothetical protein, partial [Mitsuokella multacida]|uniref:hypothetical protein n=1 Tax=Mitsuokella multacida TaxID=52226 RepID=UPI003FEE4D72
MRSTPCVSSTSTRSARPRTSARRPSCRWHRPTPQASRNSSSRTSRGRGRSSLTSRRASATQSARWSRRTRTSRAKSSVGRNCCRRRMATASSTWRCFCNR